MKTPLVSVIIPTHNRPQLTLEAVNSIRAQGFEDFEVVVVDDASTDDTPDQVVSISQEDRRVRLVRRPAPSSGESSSRNFGINRARGRYVVFVDSDDQLAPDALEHRVALMESRPELDLAVFGTRVFHTSPGDTAYVMNRETGEDDLERFLRLDFPWCVGGPIWTRQALERVGGFDEALTIYVDIELSIRALLRGLRYAKSERADYLYRTGQDGRLTQSGRFWSAQKLPQSEAYLEKVRRQLVEAGALTDRRRTLLAGHYFWVAQKWVDAGRRPEAFKCWSNAKKENLVTSRMYHVVTLFLIIQRTSFAPLLMYQLCKHWPTDMFVGGQSVCRTLPNEPKRPREISLDQLHSDHAYREILNDGPARFLGRRMSPKRIMKALWKRRRNGISTLPQATKTMRAT